MASGIRRVRGRNGLRARDAAHGHMAVVAVIFVWTVETYGKMGEAALQVVRTLGSAAAEESAPRPWHARTFADATVQRLSVALQRGVQEDQLLRAHVRRTRHLFGVNDGGAPGGGAATESVVARAGAARRAECRCT